MADNSDRTNMTGYCYHCRTIQEFHTKSNFRLPWECTRCGQVMGHNPDAKKER